MNDVLLCLCGDKASQGGHAHLFELFPLLNAIWDTEVLRVMGLNLSIEQVLDLINKLILKPFIF